MFLNFTYILQDKIRCRIRCDMQNFDLGQSSWLSPIILSFSYYSSQSLSQSSVS